MFGRRISDIVKHEVTSPPSKREVQGSNTSYYILSELYLSTGIHKIFGELSGVTLDFLKVFSDV